MRTRRNRIRRVRRAAGQGPAADAHTILTVTNDGSGNALFTTAAAHGLVGGVSLVTVSGASVAGYNRLVVVDQVDTPTTWIEFGTYTANSTGGVWA